MSKNPLISIILPVYNGEKFLNETIRSCVNQSYKNFELIIVNDCSTDRTLEIAQYFSKKEPRIKVVTNKSNLKLPASLNLGHSMSKGEFITWISDDNCLKHNALERMILSIINENVDIVYSNYELIDDAGKYLKNIELGENSILIGNAIGASFLYRKKVFTRNNGYDETLHLVEDYDFWLRCSKNSIFYHINESLYRYRIHGKSLTKQINSEKEVNDIFYSRLVIGYKNFFESFNSIDADLYSGLFSRIHTYRENNVLDLLNSYSKILKDICLISKECKSLNFQLFKRELDKRIRSIILYNTNNQKLKVLFILAYNQPHILFNYDKKRSMELIKKCLGLKSLT